MCNINNNNNNLQRRVDTRDMKTSQRIINYFTGCGGDSKYDMTDFNLRCSRDGMKLDIIGPGVVEVNHILEGGKSLALRFSLLLD